MQLRTILNRVQKFKPLVYGNVNWVEFDGESTFVPVVVAEGPGAPPSPTRRPAGK